MHTMVPRSFCTVLSGLILLFAPLAAQTKAPDGPATDGGDGLLTLEECVARALKKNFDLQIQTFNVDNARESHTVAQAEFTPTLTASVSRDGSQSYTSKNELEGTDARVGVSQKIASGATVSVSTSVDRSSTSSTSALLNPAYGADVALSVTQPLLKNAGKSVSQATIERTRIGIARAGYDYKARILTVVRDVESAYYNLCFAREQKNVRQHSLNLAQKLYDEARSRKEAGVATDLDVLQAEVGVENARRSLLLAQQTVRDREDSLLNLIGQFEFTIAPGSVKFPEIKESAPNFDHSFKLARDNQPDFLSTQANIKQLEIDATTSKNARLPSLDFGTALGYNTSEKSYGNAYRELPGSDGYSWQVDLSFRMPWGLKAENARYRTALNTLQQTRTRLQQQEQSLIVSVRNSVRSVETNIESVEISTKATMLSVKKYELEKARFDAGLSTARRVLEAQDDLENSRMSELQAKVNLRIALAELHRLEGSTIGRYRIELP